MIELAGGPNLENPCIALVGFLNWPFFKSGILPMDPFWGWTIEIFSSPRNNQREYFKQLQIIEMKMLILSFWRVTSVVNEFWKRQNYILKTLKVPTNFSFGSDYAFLMFYSYSFIESRFFQRTKSCSMVSQSFLALSANLN